MTEKKASGNWSVAEVEKLQASYKGAASNPMLDKMIPGKSTAAVRSKLVSLGLYEKNEPTSKSGGEGQRKSSIVSAIEILTGFRAGELDTLEKASKAQLDALSVALTKLSDRHNADNGVVEPTAEEA